MSQQRNPWATQLQRLLKAQDFQNEDELRQFMDSIVGKTIPELPAPQGGPKEQTQDLVFQAWDMPDDDESKEAIEMALDLDPDCIEAYEYLGEMEESMPIALVFFEKGIALRRAAFSGDFMEENRGRFWGIHETRPFMRCLASGAECLYGMDKAGEAISIYKEMLELNPNDNQGVRDTLMLYLIEAGEYEEYRHYAAIYDDIQAFPVFNKALAAFKEDGPSNEFTGLLLAALKRNKHVAKRLAAREPTEMMPELYQPGSADEADIYAYYGWEVWQHTPRAIDWLKKHSGKPAAGRKGGK